MVRGLNELSGAEYDDVINKLGGRTRSPNKYFVAYDRDACREQLNANQQVNSVDAIESLKAAIGVDNISNDVFQVVCREHTTTHFKYIKVNVDELFPLSSAFTTHREFMSEQILRDCYVSDLGNIKGINVYDTLYNPTINTPKRAFHTMAQFKSFLSEHPALAEVVKQNKNNTDVTKYTPLNNFPLDQYAAITIGGTSISDINLDSFENIEINTTPATRGRIICFSVDLFGPGSQFECDIGKFHPYNSEFNMESHARQFTARLRKEAVKNYEVSREYFDARLDDARKMYKNPMGASYIAYLACAPNFRGDSFDVVKRSEMMKRF